MTFHSVGAEEHEMFPVLQGSGAPSSLMRRLYKAVEGQRDQEYGQGEEGGRSEMLKGIAGERECQWC